MDLPIYNPASKRVSKNPPQKTMMLSAQNLVVLKERSNIFNRIKSMSEAAEEQVTLLLGQFGILHLCRSEALAEVNAAAKRGVVVNVLAQLDRRTIRFFGELDESIQIRHSDDVSSLGVLKDDDEVIQFLQVEENPVGRGREDAALVIESRSFCATQANLVEAIWDEAIEIAKVCSHGRENCRPLATDGWRGVIFRQFLQGALGLDDQLPDDDTPFDPQSFLASGSELNEARMTLQSGSTRKFTHFGHRYWRNPTPSRKSNRTGIGV